MGLWSATKAAFSGDFSKAADYAFLEESEIERGIQLDNALIAEVQSDHARGLLNDEQAATQLSNLQLSAFDNQVKQSSPAAGFVAGWKEGYENVKGAIQKVTSGILGGTWGLIPWQLKLLIVAVVAFYVYNWLKSAGLLAKWFKLKA